MNDNVRGNFYRQVLGVKRVGYTRRVPDTGSANTRFSDTDSGSFIFGTDTGNTRILYLRIRVGYGARTTRIFGSDTVPGIRVPIFLFLHNIVIKS
jgi:hypothetical protein